MSFVIRSPLRRMVTLLLRILIRQGRGIDILDVAQVINYDMLKQIERRAGQKKQKIRLPLALAEALMFLAEKAYLEWQLIGARILRQFAEDTLEKIGINLPVIERLVEMLNWKDVQEEEIRRSAAEILSKLAGKIQNSLKVSGITGAMELILSLLQNTRSLGEALDEIGEKKIFHGHHLRYDYCRFSNLGLLILKKLSRDHDYCGKIGNTRGLVPKIIDFMHTDAILLKDENVEMRQGKELVVTGGVLKELFNIFLKSKARGDVNASKVKIAAAEAIAMLALESRSNCVVIVKLGVLARLVDALEVHLVRVNAARVLRNLCLYSRHECFIDLRLIKAAAPTVLKSITSGDNKLQEVILGLATRVQVHEFRITVKIPRIRRFVVELAIWMMEGDVENVVMFRDLAIKREQELLGAKDKIDPKESELIQMILAKREDEIENKREDLAGEK
ncbi:unnamed protein product [Brassica oleracea var. botrytis]|uniref:(rape) hypothetical protein n=1 Tax=Brassica napus TaxID=3708 RepID=A0A816JHA5_BRANA|nr:unnamed protein product [Brassica napus]